MAWVGPLRPNAGDLETGGGLGRGLSRESRALREMIEGRLEHGR